LSQSTDQITRVFIGIRDIKITEGMKHKQKKDEMELDRYQMVAALAAIKRHRILVNYNHELNSKIRGFMTLN
jgi:hypothetical protein